MVACAERRTAGRLTRWGKGRRAERAVRAGVLGLGLLAGGCSLVRGARDVNRVSLQGLEPRVEQIDFKGVAAAQSDLIDALKEQSQLKDETLRYEDPRWSLVLRAGLQLVDGRCDQYLDALFRFNREQRAGRQELTAATAATAGIMGLTGAPGRAIAVVATALGLASTLFDATVGSVLFQIEPSALRNVVLQGRQLYIEQLASRTDNLRTVDNRPDMMLALQGYLTQCSPAAIEANVNNAANGSPFAVTRPGLSFDKREAAIGTGTPAVGLVGRAFRLSENRMRAPAPLPPRRAGEAAQRLPGADQLSRYERRDVQAALGLPPTEDMGAPGGATSRAIEQFQRAMGARDGGWPDEPAGTLRGERTRRTLIGVSALGAPFKTPFERFYLGNEETMPGPGGGFVGAYTVTDLQAMNDLRERLGLAEVQAGDDLWAGVRAALMARGSAGGTLDADLMAAIRSPAPR